MKCANCGHDHRVTNPCPVIVSPPGARGPDIEICGCKTFVEPPDMAVCSNCGETLAYSHSIGPIRPDLPVIFAVIWCTACKHIILAQLLPVMIPTTAAAGGKKSNLHVPGGPLG